MSLTISAAFPWCVVRDMEKKRDVAFMQSNDPFRRFVELQNYVGWSAADAACLHAIGPQLDPWLAPVADTGVGILAENLKRIMEPFYSTKARGIGLGLAITRAIIDKNKGKLHMQSEPGTGTTFFVQLPIA